MRHVEGDIIRTRDCVLLKANEDNELPYVAKVAHLWENPEDGKFSRRRGFILRRVSIYRVPFQVK